MCEDDLGWRDADGKMHWYWPPPVEAVPIMCFSCKLKEEAREEVPPEETKGLFVVLRRVAGWVRPRRDEEG